MGLKRENCGQPLVVRSVVWLMFGRSLHAFSEEEGKKDNVQQDNEHDTGDFDPC
jgi:hypothetical protein